MKTTFTKILMLSLLSASLTAAKCDSDDDDVATDDPSSVCDYIMDKCGFMYDTKSACEMDVASMDECRAECAVDQGDCETMDQCLWWAGGYDGEVDNYCSDDSGPDGTYSDFDGCVAAECPTEASACEANADCVGIFSDCYDTCADVMCLSECAETYYPGGVLVHDDLYTCFSTWCADYL